MNSKLTEWLVKPLVEGIELDVEVGDTVLMGKFKNKRVKVNFGQGGDAKGGTMRIRKSNPKARKSFRARHNCDNPGPRHKARYWSCKKW